MKTIIIFGSTYGFAKECAQKLAEQIDGEVVLVNVVTEGIMPLENFDNVVIGGSIYMGQVQKKVKAFCVANVEALKSKRVGLFLCCGLPQNFEINLKNAYPDELINVAVAKECFGGELRTEKMNFAHKFITGMMKKASAKQGTAAPVMQMTENITKMAASINNVGK